MEAKIQKLKEEMDTAVQSVEDDEKWVKLIKQYANPTELTAELLNTLVEKILVHEATTDENGNLDNLTRTFKN